MAANQAPQSRPRGGARHRPPSAGRDGEIGQTSSAPSPRAHAQEPGEKKKRPCQDLRMFSKVYSPSQHQGCSGCVQQCWSRPAPRALRSTGCFFHSPFPFEINPATLQLPCSGYRFLLLALKLGRCSRGAHPNSKLNQSLWGNLCSPLRPRGVFKHRKPALAIIALARHHQPAPKHIGATPSEDTLRF